MALSPGSSSRRIIYRIESSRHARKQMKTCASMCSFFRFQIGRIRIAPLVNRKARSIRSRAR